MTAALERYVATLPPTPSVKSGFGFSPAHDRLWAAGFPHLAWLSDDTRDLADTALELRMLDWHGRTEWPRGAAHRFMRIRRAAWPWPPGRPVTTEEMKRQFCVGLESDELVPVKKLEEMLAESFRPKAWSQLGLPNLHLLEAMIGADAVTRVAIEALERWTDAELVDWAVEQSIRVHWLGLMLARLPPDVAQARKEALRGMLDRASKAWPFDTHYRDEGTRGSGWLPLRLEAILGGAAAVDKHGEKFDGAIHGNWLLHAGDDPDLIVRHVLATKPGRYQTTFARLVYLGGEAVLDAYLDRWKKFTAPGEHLRMVRTFGEIDHPRVAEWMLEMATGSKVKTPAKDWFAAHPELGRPVLERAARTSSVATKILRTLG